MIRWFNSNSQITLTNYITDHQEYTNNGTKKEKNKLISQGVKTTNDQYYITHQTSILLNTKIIAQLVRVEEDSHTFFVQVSSHDTIYVIVNLQDLTNITPRKQEI